MKRVIIASVMLVLVSSASFAKKPIAEGKTFSTLGDYRIELADNTILMKGADCVAYKIIYENTPMDVTVAVCKDNEKKCMKYVVLSDRVSVQYVCNKSYFGVEILDKSLQKEGFKASDNSLNRSEFFRQKKLSQGELSVLEATKLIAAYFPFLINETGNPTAKN